MATSSGRLAAVISISLAAAAVMVLRAALAFGRNPMLDVGNLLPPALAFCLAGWLVRKRPALLTVLLLAVAGLGGICVSIYLLGDSLSVVAAWGLQWLAALAAVTTAVIARLSGVQSAGDQVEGTERRRTSRLGTALIGFSAGAALGLIACLTFIRFDYRGFEMGGTTTVSVFGAELFSISGIFAFLVRGVVSVVVCVATGIAGSLASWPIGTWTSGGRG